jgi:hypothetical protein
MKEAGDNSDEEKDNYVGKAKGQHFSELQYSVEPVYILKTGDIFPYDYDMNERAH